MSLFGFGAGAQIDVNFNPTESDATRAVVTQEGSEPEQLVIYQGHEPVTGNVSINVAPGKKIEHLGMKIEMIGQIEMFYDRGNHCTWVHVACVG